MQVKYDPDEDLLIIIASRKVGSGGILRDHLEVSFELEEGTEKCHKG